MSEPLFLTGKKVQHSPQGEYPLKLGNSALLVALAEDVALTPLDVPLPLGTLVLDAVDDALVLESEALRGGMVRC